MDAEHLQDTWGTAGVQKATAAVAGPVAWRAHYLCQQSLSAPHLGIKDQTPTNLIKANHVDEIEMLD